jgi:S1-C subfamily serine protease
MKKIKIGVLSFISTVGWSTALLLSSHTAPIPDKVAKILPVVHHIRPTQTAWTPRASTFAEKTRDVPFAFNTTKPQTAQVLGASTYNTDQLSPEQALNLDKPGVVSIINRLGGSLDIPDFDVDIHSFAITPRPDLPVHKTVLDEDLYGTGFIVNSGGYAITNAHVISKNDAAVSLKKQILTHYQDIYQYGLDGLTDKEYKNYSQELDKTYGMSNKENDKKIQDLIDTKIDSYIKASSKDNIDQHVIIVDKSLDPATLPKKNELETIFSKGLPVNIVAFDKDYKTSGDDVALVQIAGSNFPALPLGDTTGITSGSSVVVLGYPYNAQINEADVFQPTLTQGIVSSVKQLNNQKVFQLDNKTSEGSSGSPVTDPHGRVIGIITYINGDPSSGDQFTYALPIDLAKNLLTQNNITNDLGIYGTNFLQGISFADKNSCKKAVDAFNAAGGADSHFTPQTYVASYISSCQNLITSGQSKDSVWDTTRIFYKEHSGNAAIFSALAVMMIFFLVWLAIHLLKHAKKTQNIIPIPAPQQKLS